MAEYDDKSTTGFPEIITINRVAELTTLSEGKIRRLEAEGQFPKRLRLGKSARWLLEDVKAWVSSRNLNAVGSDASGRAEGEA